jgi:hypothetical protein
VEATIRADGVNYDGLRTVEPDAVGTRAVKHDLFNSVTVEVTNNITLR